MFKKFLEYRRRAILFVDQMKRGEWFIGGPYVISRNDVNVWISNNCYFFDVVDREFKGINYFGYFWRHYAYFFGYKRYIKSINNEFTDYVNRRMEEEI